jgi:DNA excision repair protein ERCC-3
LRPKPGGASFYTIVSRRSCEEELALHRQLFLTEQGYRFFIEDMPGGPDLEVPAVSGGGERDPDRNTHRGGDDGDLFN